MSSAEWHSRREALRNILRLELLNPGANVGQCVSPRQGEPIRNEWQARRTALPWYLIITYAVMGKSGREQTHSRTLEIAKRLGVRLSSAAFLSVAELSVILRQFPREQKMIFGKSLD